MEVFGLPLHPLILHATVVFVPLAAAGGIGISLIRPLRTRYGSLVTIVAFVAAVCTYITQEAGEDFAKTFTRPTAAMERHFHLGDGLLAWVIVLFAGTAILMLGDLLVKRGQARGRIAVIAGMVVTVVAAVISTVQVIRIGHSGATAVWGNGS